MIRLIVITCLLLTACSRPQGFTLKKITSRTPTKEQTITSRLDSIQALFDAPLSFVGSGNHTYAFATADKTHVIKFFKQNHFRPYTWLDYLPLPDKLNPKRLSKRRSNANDRADTFQSLELASRYLKDQTGLVYLHLHRTNNIERKVKLIYSEDRQPICDIDKMEFVIQKCADIGFKHIDKLIETGAKIEAVQCLLSYLKLIRTRCQKGLGDRDLQFYKNFGFTEGKPIEVDIGDFCTKPAMKEKSLWSQEVQAASHELIAYLQDACPEMLDTFKLKIQELIE